ncbi:DUF6166 domain-containing protein [Pseudomonas sp. Z2-11]
MDNPGLEDMDFSKVQIAQSDDSYDAHAKASILLRVVEGAGVALYQHKPGGSAENLPTRRDLYKYDGGLAWGYKGSGAVNLAHAIAGKIYEYDQLSSTELSDKAYQIVELVVSKLQKDEPADLQISEIKKLLG